MPVYVHVSVCGYDGEFVLSRVRCVHQPGTVIGVKHTIALLHTFASLHTDENETATTPVCIKCSFQAVSAGVKVVRKIHFSSPLAGLPKEELAHVNSWLQNIR